MLATNQVALQYAIDAAWFGTDQPQLALSTYEVNCGGTSSISPTAVNNAYNQAVWDAGGLRQDVRHRPAGVDDEGRRDPGELCPESGNGRGRPGPGHVPGCRRAGRRRGRLARHVRCVVERRERTGHGTYVNAADKDSNTQVQAAGKLAAQEDADAVTDDENDVTDDGDYDIALDQQRDTALDNTANSTGTPLAEDQAEDANDELTMEEEYAGAGDTLDRQDDTADLSDAQDDIAADVRAATGIDDAQAIDAKTTAETEDSRVTTEEQADATEGDGDTKAAACQSAADQVALASYQTAKAEAQSLYQNALATAGVSRVSGMASAMETYNLSQASNALATYSSTVAQSTRPNRSPPPRPT